MRRMECYPGYYPKKEPQGFHELLSHLATFDGAVIDDRERVNRGHRDVQKHLILNPDIVIKEDSLSGKYREEMYMSDGNPSASDAVFLARPSGSTNGDYTLIIVEVKGILRRPTRYENGIGIRKLGKTRNHNEAIRQLGQAGRFYAAAGGRRLYFEVPYTPVEHGDIKFKYRGWIGDLNRIGDVYMHGPFDVTREVRHWLKATPRSSSP